MANIVIMPGGFHPFHAGHAALYQSIKEKYGDSDVYVAASNNQKQRPFPFEIKEKLARISGVQPGEFVQVKSPFVPTEITSKYDPDNDTIVFVRSEKDKNEYPLPGGTKKDGSPGYFQHIDSAGLLPFSKVGYMDYLPVKEFAGITSATQIREVWPSLNDEQREEFVTEIYPHIVGNDRLIKNVVQLLSKGMSLNEGLAYIDSKGERVEYQRPDLPTDIEDLVINWFNDRDRYTKATLQSKGYKVDVDDHSNNIVVTDKKGREFTVSVDEAMGKLIQQAYEEPINEDKPVARYNTKQANKMIRQYCREKGIPIQKILTQRVSGRRKQHGGHLDPRRNLTVMATVHRPDVRPWTIRQRFDFATQRYENPAFTQEDANNIQTILDAPKVTITGGGNYLNVHGVMKGELNDEPIVRETFVDPDESKQYWNHDAQRDVIGTQIEMPLTDTPNLNGRRQGYNEEESFLSNIEKGFDMVRTLIKECTDEQKSKSVSLHRKLFELMEEEKDNVIQLRGFGKETDKKVVDINKVRAEKTKDQEREDNYYSGRRAEQEELLARLQAELLNAKQEFDELASAKLLPIEMIDAMESIDKLIDYIENWSGSADQNDFPFTEDLVEKLHLKTVQLKEYFGGTRDTSAPRVLRQKTPRLSPNAFWNKIDLSETADYIEEK